MSHLLRNLDLPGRLRQNDLVARCFAGVRGVDGGELDDRMIALRIKAIVLASIASLETGCRGLRSMARVNAPSWSG